MSNSEQASTSAEEQWDRFRSGDTDAFTVLYNTHVRLLLSYGRKIHNDRQVVADAVQELFTRLWTRKEFIGPTTSVKFYLFKSLRTSLAKEVKKAQGKTYDFETSQSLIQSIASYESELVSKEAELEKKEQVQKAISLLSKREQEILYLKYFGNLSNEEIGELLDIKYQSVKNTSFSAIKKLRKYFSKSELHILFLAIGSNLV